MTFHDDAERAPRRPSSAASPISSASLEPSSLVVDEGVPQVVVAVFPDVIQAEIGKGTLEAAGIAARLVDDLTAGVAPHLALAIGGVRVVVAEPDADEARAVLANPARFVDHVEEPAFRVRTSLAGPVAATAGGVALLVGALLGAALGAGTPFVLAAAAAAVGGLIGSRMRRDYCSRLGCAHRIPEDATVCPGCGHTLRGTLKNASSRLEAAEALAGAESDDGHIGASV